MAGIELVLSPSKALKRKDVVTIGKMIAKQAARKDVNTLTIKVEEIPDGESPTFTLFGYAWAITD